MKIQSICFITHHKLWYKQVEAFSIERSQQKYSQMSLPISEPLEDKCLIGKPNVDDTGISLLCSPSKDVISKAIESEVSVPQSDS